MVGLKNCITDESIFEGPKCVFSHTAQLSAEIWSLPHISAALSITSSAGSNLCADVEDLLSLSLHKNQASVWRSSRRQRSTGVHGQTLNSPANEATQLPVTQIDEPICVLLAESYLNVM